MTTYEYHEKREINFATFILRIKKFDESMKNTKKKHFNCVHSNERVRKATTDPSNDKNLMLFSSFWAFTLNLTWFHFKCSGTQCEYDIQQMGSLSELCSQVIQPFFFLLLRTGLIRSPENWSVSIISKALKFNFKCHSKMEYVIPPFFIIQPLSAFDDHYVLTFRI